MAKLIDAYICCPLCGSQELTHQDGGRLCGKCGHPDFNNPIAAVAVYLLDAQDRVLLIRRAKDPALGKWAPPGGFVDAGESFEQAARREVEEETGVRVSSLRYLGSFPNQYVYRGLSRPVCDVFFLGRADSFEVVLQQEEASEFRLCPLVDIDPQELAFDSMRQALEILRAPGKN